MMSLSRNGRKPLIATTAASAALAVALVPGLAAAAVPATNYLVIDFGASGYTLADQSPGGENGWNSWTHTSTRYDWALTNNSAPSTLPTDQVSLRMSNAVGNVNLYPNVNQLTSPALSEVAGETATGATKDIFEASFTIASVTGDLQPRLAVAVAADDATGSRSGGAVTFVHTATGLQLVASWVDPAATAADTADWRTQYSATFDATVPHTIRMVSTYVPGDTSVGPDTLKVYVDGTLAIDGYTYEGYHEVASSPATTQEKRTSASLLFRATRIVDSTEGTAVGLPTSLDPTTPEMTALDGQGYLFSGISYQTYLSTPSTNPPVAPEPEPATPGSELAAENTEPGGQTYFEGEGFEPFENVGVTVHSTPFFAGWFRANGAGQVSGYVTLPPTIASGTHTIQAIGQSSGVVASAAFSVALAHSGSTLNAGIPIAAGVLLLLGGAGVFTAARRRRSADNAGSRTGQR